MLDSISALAPSLRDLVEGVWDLDVPDGATARAMAVKVLPTASSVLCVHYRAPIISDRRNYEHCAYKSVVIGVQRAAVTVRPCGPTGSMIVRFKPGAAARVFGPQMDAFADANVELDDLVGAVARDRLQTQLREAANQSARLAVIERFLRPRASRNGDAIVREAVQRLWVNPAQGVASLAGMLGISERQLGRRFLASVGATPKQVVRVLRLEKLITARHRGAAWADIAVACGFNDQAHMIHDFKALAGTTPDAFVRDALTGPRGALNAALAMSGFYNTAVV